MIHVLSRPLVQAIAIAWIVGVVILWAVVVVGARADALCESTANLTPEDDDFHE